MLAEQLDSLFFLVRQDLTSSPGWPRTLHPAALAYKMQKWWVVCILEADSRALCVHVQVYLLCMCVKARGDHME